MWGRRYETKHVQTALSHQFCGAAGAVRRRRGDLAVQLSHHHGGVVEPGAGLSGTTVLGALRLYGSGGLRGGSVLPGAPAGGVLYGEGRTGILSGAGGKHPDCRAGGGAAGAAGGHPRPAAEGGLSGDYHPGLWDDYCKHHQQSALLRPAGAGPGLRLLGALRHGIGFFQRRKNAVSMGIRPGSHPLHDRHVPVCPLQIWPLYPGHSGQ